MDGRQRAALGDDRQQARSRRTADASRRHLELRRFPVGSQVRCRVEHDKDQAGGLQRYGRYGGADTGPPQPLSRSASAALIGRSLDV